jgi:predicted acylesterase/phospholipase RssA
MPGPNPDPLTLAEICRLFPLQRLEPIKRGGFEIGLVLGGTVSAGAYTAGVLDYLIEALDAWIRAKEESSAEAPMHDVIISTIAGASGGAIYASVFARASGWSFPHQAEESNPFYRAAIGVDFKGLLSPDPEAGRPLGSLFNSTAMDDSAARILGFEGKGLGSNGTPTQRTYLADPVRLFLMVGNLTGIPYTIKFSSQGELEHDLISHSDFVRFGVSVDGGIPNEPKLRPDEISLHQRSPENWDLLRAAALASSAFPGLLRARPLQRKLELLRYRVTMLPREQGLPDVIPLVPKWGELRDGEPLEGVVNFAGIDGGVFNNQPFDVVRHSLAGLLGRNNRVGAEADRAVIMVDPFSDAVPLGPRIPPPLFELLLPFLGSLIYQARFKPEDIALAQKEDVYSRFLIAPYGPGPGETPMAGKRALASGGLAGFLGFVDRGFFHYDFLVGRRNAYEFLRSEFIFPESNPIFDQWTEAQKAAQREPSPNGNSIPVKDGYLPMIPLMRQLRENPPRAMTSALWPRLRKLPEYVPSAIERRLDAIYDSLRHDFQPRNCLDLKYMIVSAYVWVGWRFGVRGALRESALETIKRALKDQRLL